MREADLPALGAFLRARREALQPHDVGLVRGPRRRAPGLRREEVADLCGMSADYVARLERGDGPHPSVEMLAALARGLRLTRAERDHLFLLCGRVAPGAASSEHVGPGLQRILDRLADTDTAAVVHGQASTTLRQTPLAEALFGDHRHFTGLARSAVHRWFADPHGRDLYPPDTHAHVSRVHACKVRAEAARFGPGSFADQVVADLLRTDAEFAQVWAREEVGLRFDTLKRLVHPVVGPLDLFCQTLVEPDTGQTLLVLTATPGSADHDRLQLLQVVGAQRFEG